MRPARSLPASIAYSYDHLPDAARRLLPAVSLFHGVADTDVLGWFAEHPEVPARFQGVAAGEWAELLDRAAGLGLLTRLGAGMYRIHPALPSFLVERWRAADPDAYGDQRAAAAEALLDACARLGRWLRQQIQRGDAALAFAVIDHQRRTLGGLLTHALARRRWEAAQAIAQPLNTYWNSRGLAEEARGWVDRIRPGD